MNNKNVENPAERFFFGKHYTDDRVYECESYDGYDFATASAADIAVFVMLSTAT